MDDGVEVEFHVMPFDDLIEHEPTDWCVCHPTLQQVSPTGGLWVMRHHPLDDRPPYRLSHPGWT